MKRLLLTTLALAAGAQGAAAHKIKSKTEADKTPAFDITSAGATTDGRLTTFMMELAGVAGSVKPVPVGQLTGAKVESYVWPTNLDPSVVGFDKESGILSLAITVSTTRRFMTRIRTATRPMTARTGIRTGSCWSRTKPAARVSRSATCRPASICCRRRLPIFPLRLTARA